MRSEGMDGTDQKILDILRENARLSYKEIGERAGISRVSVKARMDAMQEKGIIRGFRTITDTTQVSEGTRFFLDVECAPEFYEEMTAFLAASSMIRRLYAVSGDCRLHAEGFAPNARSLECFTNALYRKRKGVRRLGCHTVLSTLVDVDGGISYDRYQEHEDLEGGEASGDRP